MKIVEITPITPWKENKGGTSALQYHLLAGRPKDVSVDVWSFNYNDLSADEIRAVEKELDVSIHLLKKPWFRTFVVNKGLKFVRLILKYPIFNYIWLSEKSIANINSIRADGIWIYGEEMGRVAKQLNKYKRIHTLPDAESLYYERLGGIRKIVSGNKFKRMENVMDRAVIYHLVGAADVEWFKKMAPGVDARFIRHPHYELKEKVVEFGERVKLLVAGKNNLYMKGKAEEMIEVLQEINNVQGFEITFLGNGWSECAEELKKIGYQVRSIEYAEEYVDEVIKYDVQITPISLGTGTKGKVLDAMANGVLVVGTEYALENIVEGGVLYKNREELKNVLLDILNDKAKYEAMAVAVRDKVRLEHGRYRVSQEMFDLFKNV